MNIKDPLRLIWKSLLLWWEEWYRMIWLGIVWALCVFTILLGPPATFALFSYVRGIIEKKDPGWKDFYQAVKDYFPNSWIWMLSNLVFYFVVYSNIVFYGTLESGWKPFLQGIAYGIGVLWTIVQVYALPYLIIQHDKSQITAWKNGLFTILASPLFTLLLSVVIGALLFLHLFGVPFLIGGPALVVVLASLGVEDRLQKFQLRENRSD